MINGLERVQMYTMSYRVIGRGGPFRNHGSRLLGWTAKVYVRGLGLAFRVWGSGLGFFSFWVQGLGFRVYGFRVYGFGFRFRVYGLYRTVSTLHAYSYPTPIWGEVSTS